MRKGKGILVKMLQGNKGIIMTPKGEFIKVKVPEGSDVGKEIEFTKGPSYLPLVAGFILILFLSFNLLNNTTPVTAAYMTLDINSGIELGLDKKLNVVSVNPLDERGNEFVKNLSLKGTSIDKAVEKIMDEAVKNNIINEKQENNCEVIFATVTNTGPEVALNEELVESWVYENLGKHHIKCDIIIQTASQEDLNNAREQKITPAKYIMLQKIEEKGIILEQDREELLKSSVKELARIIREMDNKEKDSIVELTDNEVINGNKDNKLDNGDIKILVNKEFEETDDEDEKFNGRPEKDKKQKETPSEKVKGNKEKEKNSSQKSKGDKEREKTPPGKVKKDKEQGKNPPEKLKRDKEREKLPSRHLRRDFPQEKAYSMKKVDTLKTKVDRGPEKGQPHQAQFKNGEKQGNGYEEHKSNIPRSPKMMEDIDNHKILNDGEKFIFEMLNITKTNHNFSK